MLAIKTMLILSEESAVGNIVSFSLDKMMHADCSLISRPAFQLLYLRKKGPTMEYWPTPHFGLNFLLRSKVYSNMHPYVAALEHACAITIKWAWLRLLAMHDRSHLMPCTCMQPPPHAFTVSSHNDWVIMAMEMLLRRQ